jgi:dolichol-phosphate mannosyltransferase
VTSLVVIPTYNERGTIGHVIERLLSATRPDDVHALVVDDSSPDRTIEAIPEGHPGVHALRRASKLGLGSAYVAGFRWGLERDYDAFLEMDADLSHDPADVPRLLDALEGADLAIGSRYVAGGRVENWSTARRVLSRAGNIYANAWLRLGINDLTSGFRAYRRSAIESIDLDSIRSEGYAFQIEMTLRVGRAGGRMVEVPITFVERISGTSKMTGKIVAEAVTKVPRWAIRGP